MKYAPNRDMTADEGIEHELRWRISQYVNIEPVSRLMPAADGGTPVRLTIDEYGRMAGHILGLAEALLIIRHGVTNVYGDDPQQLVDAITREVICADAT